MLVVCNRIAANCIHRSHAKQFHRAVPDTHESKMRINDPAILAQVEAAFWQVVAAHVRCAASMSQRR
ncbi:hypothetical protein OR16_18791 [Cupriavidus basilensis OR16]|uniref:Uncharacterized protein n=1 Tax=Cupriavidus basilensis OR16 TaxID=1127483 RepID=H1S755_9BURK|nr:hypothetical protein OR16_18791 [Cupriavidus basilensis OR16]